VLLAATYPVIHFAYGIGMLRGLLRFEAHVGRSLRSARRPQAMVAAQRLRQHVHAEHDVIATARHLRAHYRSVGGR
jgi:hypothetical protein